VSTPQFDAGTRVVRRVDVAEDAVIVDAGCGSGRVTELLLDTYPHATVVAIDASASMLAAAEKRLRRHAPRLELVHADLTETWPLQRPADAVVSTNTFHWILDHDTLFAAAFEVLKAGGRLVAVAGGQGSLRAVRDAARRVGVLVDGINNYADAAPTADRLRAAGFVDVRCWLEDEQVRFPTRQALGEYLATAALAPYERGAELASQVAEDIVDPVADFVRLNILARRPPENT
jgi:trans-aconitate 2-methyltransferase